MYTKLTISTQTIRLSLGWLLLVSTTAFLTRYGGQLSGQGVIVAACSLLLLCSWLLLVYASAKMVQKGVIQAEKIAGGVLNGKALRLPQPKFPPEAKYAHATGSVNVEVLVSESGNVIAAKALTGHPLLRKSAVAAATLAIFKPMKIHERHVKVAGTLVYDFSPRLSVMQIGVILSAAKESGKLESDFPAVSIAEFLPTDWQEEQQHIEQISVWQKQIMLDSILPSYSSSEHEANFDLESETSLSFTRKNYLELLESLIGLLKERFSEDEIEYWSFILGLNLGKINTHFEDDAVLRQKLIELSHIADSAPSEVAPELVAQLQDLTIYANNGDFSEANKEKIKSFLSRIQ